MNQIGNWHVLLNDEIITYKRRFNWCRCNSNVLTLYPFIWLFGQNLEQCTSNYPLFLGNESKEKVYYVTVNLRGKFISLPKQCSFWIVFFSGRWVGPGWQSVWWQVWIVDAQGDVSSLLYGRETLSNRTLPISNLSCTINPKTSPSHKLALFNR